MSSLPAILIVEDEPTLAKNMRLFLQNAGFDVHTANCGKAALAELEGFKPDVILLDYRLPDTDGIELIGRIHRIDNGVRTIIITGEGNIQIAVQAMKAGAYDYLIKPVALKELSIMLEKLARHERLEGALDYYRHKQAESSGLSKLCGQSPPMLALKRQIAQLLEAERSLTDGVPASILITGETGTGKELVARAFHFDGPRRGGAFIEVNCAAIPAHLLEAELFGYERGAFTDARERKMGLVETADGGTLFLDEIGDMEPALQTKLLKLLENRSVRRLGGLRDKQVDARIIAATNCQLEQLVAQGKFRPDLYFRLRVVQIQLSPLRERGDDIIALAENMLLEHAGRYRKPLLRLNAAAQRALRAYAWPGNVRELRNMMEQLVLMASGAEIDAAQLPLSSALSTSFTAVLPTAASSQLAAGALNLGEMEKRLLLEALERTHGNVTRAAELLGLTRDALRYRMEKYGINAVN
ncbi:MAG: sigma-54 dependent transcriptional regulator [Pseudomonadota bacterium]